MFLGEVYTVDQGPNDIVATGGEDDKAYIWNAKSGAVLFECNGKRRKTSFTNLLLTFFSLYSNCFVEHKDSVTFVKFNAKKTLLATADMSGIIQIWKLDEFKKLQQFQIGDLEVRSFN